MEADTSLCDSGDFGTDRDFLTCRTDGELLDDVGHHYGDCDDNEEDDDCDEDVDLDMTELSEDFRSRINLSSCLKSRPCSVCLYLAMALLVLSCVVAVVVVSILVVTPYRHANTFVQAYCSVVQTVTDNSARQCSCGKGCYSSFPCITVTARIMLESTDPTVNQRESWTAAMHEDESTTKRQCSFHPACKASEQDNTSAVEKYIEDYGESGHNYTCLYNPRHTTEVIRTRRFHLRHVMHGLLWPVLMLGAVTVTFVFTLRYRGCTLVF